MKVLPLEMSRSCRGISSAWTGDSVKSYRTRVSTLVDSSWQGECIFICAENPHNIGERSRELFNMGWRQLSLAVGRGVYCLGMVSSPVAVNGYLGDMLTDRLEWRGKENNKTN